MKIRDLGWGRLWDTHVNKHFLRNVLLRKKLFYVYVCVCVHVHRGVCRHAQSEERASNPSELKLQVFSDLQVCYADAKICIQVHRIAHQVLVTVNHLSSPGYQYF